MQLTEKCVDKKGKKIYMYRKRKKKKYKKRRTKRERERKMNEVEMGVEGGNMHKNHQWDIRR